MTVYNYRDKILQSVSIDNRLRNSPNDSIAVSSSADNFTTQGTSITPSSIILTASLAGYFASAPVGLITWQGPGVTQSTGQVLVVSPAMMGITSQSSGISSQYVATITYGGLTKSATKVIQVSSPQVVGSIVPTSIQVATNADGSGGVYGQILQVYLNYGNGNLDTAGWQFSWQTVGVYGTPTDSTYSITGLSGDAGTVTCTASKTGYANILVKTYISKSKIGATGPQGATGATGATGLQGIAGPQGIAGLQGAVGPSGTQGAKTSASYVYYYSPTGAVPPAPNASGTVTYTFGTGAIQGLYSGWSTSVNIDTSQATGKSYACYFYVEETAPGSGQGQCYFSSVSTHINFDGVVTFTNTSGAITKDGSGITIINADKITTGTVRARDFVTKITDSGNRIVIGSSTHPNYPHSILGFDAGGSSVFELATGGAFATQTYTDATLTVRQAPAYSGIPATDCAGIFAGGGLIGFSLPQVPNADTTKHAQGGLGLTTDGVANATGVYGLTTLNQAQSRAGFFQRKTVPGDTLISGNAVEIVSDQGQLHCIGVATFATGTSIYGVQNFYNSPVGAQTTFHCPTLFNNTSTFASTMVINNPGQTGISITSALTGLSIASGLTYGLYNGSASTFDGAQYFNAAAYFTSTTHSALSTFNGGIDCKYNAKFYGSTGISQMDVYRDNGAAGINMQWGLNSSNAIYIQYGDVMIDNGTVLSFTGAHNILIKHTDCAYLEIGDILVDTQVYEKKSVNNTLTFTNRSFSSLQRSVIGALNHSPTLITQANIPAFLLDSGQVYQLIGTTAHSCCNSLGEGQINVCGEGGDLEVGDLIVTSSLPGKGMKQADDVIRNYTVAKSREAVTFSSPTEVKMVACIYLCG